MKNANKIAFISPLKDNEKDVFSKYYNNLERNLKGIVLEMLLQNKAYP